MSNTSVEATETKVNHTAVAFADMKVGQRFHVTISGTYQLVEKTEYIKSGSHVYNVRKLEGRDGRGFVYRDANVVLEVTQPPAEEKNGEFRSFANINRAIAQRRVESTRDVMAAFSAQRRALTQNQTQTEEN